ncbi:sulfurtransferase [Robertkochia marina]|uniref:Molybdopterin-synthase adenylyltransferase n=1 Tax=Robertkochia marina TaxID=1227945 RepID=A0A4S3M3Z6_9FLAO|nr:HesA/MoeB/ThiF family protein [Robertkochia marina]THD69823.1 sulfurtransferase [Robertkochia marina]TRZ46832.1 sulfurtransferase [Robertkochia marina]
MSDRYIRQRTLNTFGDAAQDKLQQASVLVIGAGGLGVPALQYLNAMGVGRLGIVDADTVDLSNLHRQPIYTENDLGKFKAEVIGNFLKAQNSETEKVIYKTFLQPTNALELISEYDLVLDASDNFGTRYLVNDSCVILNKPFIYGGLFGFEGQVSVFNYRGGPTYRCLYPEMPDRVIADCNTHGVLGVVPGIIGNLQAMEVVKILTGIGEVLSGKLLLVDTLSMQTHKMNIAAIRENLELKSLTKEQYMVPCSSMKGLDPEALEAAAGEFFLLDVRSKDEFSAYHIPGSRNIPLDELGDRKGEIPVDRPVCLICQQAIRTKPAAAVLEDHGVALYELTGGLRNYLEFIKGVRIPDTQ